MDYGKGLKLSKVNTIGAVDREKFAMYLAARQIACELPSCNDQAVEILCLPVPFYLCLTHTNLVKFNRTKARVIAVQCMSSMALEVEHAKRMYYDIRDGVETVVVIKQPGVNSLDSATEASAELESLDAHLAMEESSLGVDFFM